MTPGAPHKGFAAAIRADEGGELRVDSGGRPLKAGWRAWSNARRSGAAATAGRWRGSRSRGAASTRPRPWPARPRRGDQSGESVGRVAVRLYTASCWRKARFSRASWRWPPQTNGRSRSRWSRSVIIELGFSPDQSRHINRLADGRSFGEGQGQGRATIASRPCATAHTSAGCSRRRPRRPRIGASLGRRVHHRDRLAPGRGSHTS